MKAYPGTKRGWQCPYCDEVNTQEPIQRTYYRHDDGDYVEGLSDASSYYYFSSDCDSVELEFCPECDCDVTEEVQYEQVWLCGECEGEYVDKEVARECCL